MDNEKRQSLSVYHMEQAEVYLAKKEFLKCIVFPLHYTFFIYRPFFFT